MFARTLNFPKRRWNALRGYSRTSIISSKGISYARSLTGWSQKIPVASRIRATWIKSTTTKKGWEGSLKADRHQKFSTSQNVIGSSDTGCSSEKGGESMFSGWSLNGQEASLRYKCGITHRIGRDGLIGANRCRKSARSSHGSRRQTLFLLSLEPGLGTF